MTQRIHHSVVLAAAFSLATVTLAQNSTTPPPSQHPILTVIGKGVQIYICRQSAAESQWIFQAPEAILTDASGKPIGTHGAGPIWKSNDGSTVKGELFQKSPSPDARSIPWLLLKAVSPSGSGIMTRVEFIRRSDTHGGVSPTTGCDPHTSTLSRESPTAQPTPSTPRHPESHQPSLCSPTSPQPPAPPNPAD